MSDEATATVAGTRSKRGLRPALVLLAVAVVALIAIPLLLALL
ncbi:MAG: hypothetical protein AAF962_27245 [Actinomycetota bacterium]